MSKEIVDFTEIELRDIFKRAGLNSQEIDRAINEYLRYRESEINALSLLSYNDLKKLGAPAILEEIKKIKPGAEIIDDILTYFSFYLENKKTIIEIYQESKSWDKVITTAVYSDSKECQEAFIDFVEETYQTKVKDGKHLQKLTGIKEETLEGLEETVINSKYNKYLRALDKAIKEGALYKDLVKIKAKDFGLIDKYEEAILWAIEKNFLIGEPNTSVRPDLRTIANELQAPYSVIMDTYKISNGWKL